jgi:hypothetical protein
MISPRIAQCNAGRFDYCSRVHLYEDLLCSFVLSFSSCVKIEGDSCQCAGQPIVQKLALIGSFIRSTGCSLFHFGWELLITE